MKEFGTAIVLAGGKSSRMGFDKQHLMLHNSRLVQRITETLLDAFDQVVLVTQTPELYGGLSVQTVEDKIKGMGPLGGIHAGLLAAHSRYAFVIACDMPGLDLGYIEFMKDRLRGSDYQACVTRFGEWIEPFHAYYSKDQIQDMEAFLETGRKSVNRFLDSQKTLYVPESEARKFSPDWEMFYNLNTREDLAHYMTRTRESS